MIAFWLFSMISFVVLSLSMKPIFTVHVGESEKMSNVIETLRRVNINHISVVIFVFVKTKRERLDESGHYVGLM